MYFKISFVTWLNAARKDHARRVELAATGMRRDSIKYESVERDDFIQIEVEGYEEIEVTSSEDDEAANRRMSVIGLPTDLLPLSP